MDPRCPRDIDADILVEAAGRHDVEPGQVVAALWEMTDSNPRTPAEQAARTARRRQQERTDEPPEIGDVLDMELNPDDDRRYLVLFDQDYHDLILDTDDTVALLVDCNQALEILRLSSSLVAALAPEHAPDEEPLEAIIDALQEVQADGE